MSDAMAVGRTIGALQAKCEEWEQESQRLRKGYKEAQELIRTLDGEQAMWRDKATKANAECERLRARLYANADAAEKRDAELEWRGDEIRRLERELSDARAELGEANRQVECARKDEQR